MNYWFIADTHFGHSNIIKYCNRPFKDVVEMNETIINNWNNVVDKNDIVYHLGDLCFGDEKDIANYLRQLQGNIKIVFGNHDKVLKKFAKKDINAHLDLRNRIEFLGDYKEITIENQFIVLSHYAFRVFNKSHRGGWNLWGHSHGSLSDDPHSLSIDIGVDCHNYTPINFEQVKKIMSKKLWKPIDHHGEKLDTGGVGLSKEDYIKADRKRLYEQLKREFNGE
jgi:calcineurin-like phosphoesterase family protein